MARRKRHNRRTRNSALGICARKNRGKKGANFRRAVGACIRERSK